MALNLPRIKSEMNPGERNGVERDDEGSRKAQGTGLSNGGFDTVNGVHGGVGRSKGNAI